MIEIREFGFITMVNKMVIGIENVIMKVDSKPWLIKWLLDFGNKIMKFESLKLNWFSTLNFCLSLFQFPNLSTRLRLCLLPLSPSYLELIYVSNLYLVSRFST